MHGRVTAESDGEGEEGRSGNRGKGVKVELFRNSECDNWSKRIFLQEGGEDEEITEQRRPLLKSETRCYCDILLH